jgi:hypothetical protein
MKRYLKYWPLLIFGVILCFTAYVYSTDEDTPINQNPFMNEQEKREEQDRKIKEMKTPTNEGVEEIEGIPDIG